jgi:hypothetical protein
VAVERDPGPLWRIVVLGLAWDAASCTSRCGTPASSWAAVPEAVAASEAIVGYLAGLVAAKQAHQPTIW